MICISVKKLILNRFSVMCRLEKIKDTLETLKLLMNGPIAISDEELNTLTVMKPKSAY